MTTFLAAATLGHNKASAFVSRARHPSSPCDWKAIGSGGYAVASERVLTRVGYNSALE